MTITLGISAATGPISLGLIDEDAVLAEVTLAPQKKGAEFIDEYITSLCDQAKISTNDISLVGVVNGPGQYTGLRLTVSAAKTLGQVLKIPVIPISSLEAQVYPHRQMNGTFFSVIPARPGEVNCAMLATNNNSVRWLTDTFVISNKQLLSQLHKIEETVYLIGDCPSELTEGLNDARYVKHLPETIRGIVVAQMARQAHSEGNAGKLKDVMPKYSYPAVAK